MLALSRKLASAIAAVDGFGRHSALIPHMSQLVTWSCLVAVVAMVAKVASELASEQANDALSLALWPSRLASCATPACSAQVA